MPHLLAQQLSLVVPRSMSLVGPVGAEAAEQVAKHLGLPVVEHTRSDGGEVGGGEEVEHFEPFDIADAVGQLAEELGVARVAAEGDVGQP